MKKHGCRGTNRPRPRKGSRQEDISIAEATAQLDDVREAEVAADHDIAERQDELDAAALPLVSPPEAGVVSMASRPPTEPINTGIPAVSGNGAMAVAN